MTLGLLLAASLAFQTPVQRPQLREYWTTLSSARSVADARAIAKPTSSGSRYDPDIAAGLLKLREYELTYERTTALEATRMLERVVERAPKDAWAHYALGVMLARGPDVRMRPYQERDVYVVHSLGTLAALHAPRELQRALELDPSLDLAAVELGQLSIDFADRTLMRGALTSLLESATPQTSAVIMMQSQLQQRLGKKAEAVTLAASAADAGFDPSVASYRRAEALFRARGATVRAGSGAVNPTPGVDEEAATAAYFDGVTQLTPEGADLYYSAIDLLLNPDEDAKWKNATLEERKTWLRDFWEMRAALAGVSVPRRLGEHFKRIARLDPYRSAKTSATPTAQALKSGNQPALASLTPQILNIVRHGDSNRQQKYYYCEPGWDTLPVPMQPDLGSCMTSPYGRMRNMSHGDCPPLPTDLWIHPGIMEGFLKCKAMGGLPDEMDIVGMHGNRYAAAKKSVKGETFYPAYTKPIVMAWEAFQFHGPGASGAEVVAAVGVMTRSVPALTDTTGLMNAVMNVTLADTINNRVTRARADIEVPPPPQLGPEDYVLFHASTTARSANAVALRIALETPDGAAGAIAYGQMDIDAFPADSLTMSDIVLSPQEGMSSFVRGDVGLTLAPGRVFTRDETPVMYYEVYGVKVGARLTTEIRVDRVRGTIEKLKAVINGTHDLSLHFDDIATAPVEHYGLQTERSLGLSALQPGDYRLTVIITDNSTGRTTTRSRLLVVK